MQFLNDFANSHLPPLVRLALPLLLFFVCRLLLLLLQLVSSLAAFFASVWVPVLGSAASVFVFHFESVLLICCCCCCLCFCYLFCYLHISKITPLNYQREHSEKNVEKNNAIVYTRATTKIKCVFQEWKPKTRAQKRTKRSAKSACCAGIWFILCGFLRFLF